MQSLGTIRELVQSIYLCLWNARKDKKITSKVYLFQMSVLHLTDIHNRSFVTNTTSYASLSTQCCVMVNVLSQILKIATMMSTCEGHYYNQHLSIF